MQQDISVIVWISKIQGDPRSRATEKLEILIFQVRTLQYNTVKNIKKLDVPILAIFAI